MSLSCGLHLNAQQHLASPARVLRNAVLLAEPALQVCVLSRLQGSHEGLRAWNIGKVISVGSGAAAKPSAKAAAKGKGKAASKEDDWEDSEEASGAKKGGKARGGAKAGAKAGEKLVVKRYFRPEDISEDQAYKSSHFEIYASGASCFAYRCHCRCRCCRCWAGGCCKRRALRLLLPVLPQLCCRAKQPFSAPAQCFCAPLLRDVSQYVTYHLHHHPFHRAEEEVTVSVDDVEGQCRVVPKGYPTGERAGELMLVLDRAEEVPVCKQSSAVICKHCTGTLNRQTLHRARVVCSAHFPPFPHLPLPLRLLHLRVHSHLHT